MSSSRRTRRRKSVQTQLNKENDPNDNHANSDESGSVDRSIASGSGGARQPVKKRQTYVWLIERAFDSEEDVKFFFEMEPFWKKDSVKHLKSGKKTLHYCNRVGRVGSQCPAKIYIWEKTDKTLHLMRNGMDHCHDAEGQKQKPGVIDGRVMKKVEELVRLRVRPRAISHLIREDEGFPVKPTENQVII